MLLRYTEGLRELARRDLRALRRHGARPPRSAALVSGDCANHGHESHPGVTRAPGETRGGAGGNALPPRARGSWDVMAELVGYLDALVAQGRATCRLAKMGSGTPRSQTLRGVTSPWRRVRKLRSVVTGAASGIGCVRAALAREGSDVVVSDVNDEGGKQSRRDRALDAKRSTCTRMSRPGRGLSALKQSIRVEGHCDSSTRRRYWHAGPRTPCAGSGTSSSHQSPLAHLALRELLAHAGARHRYLLHTSSSAGTSFPSLISYV